jgi:hypothetical protein
VSSQVNAETVPFKPQPVPSTYFPILLFIIN